MAYMDREPLNLGKIVAFRQNNQGTGRVGIPTAVSLSSKDKEFPAVSDPAGDTPSTSKGKRGPADLSKRPALRETY